MKAAFPIVLILSLVFSAIRVGAQDWGSSWARVQALDKWSDIEVLDRAGATYRGRFDEADDVSVVIRAGALITRINREDVREIATGGRKGSSAGAAGGVVFGWLLAALGTGAWAPFGTMTIGLPLGLGLAGYYAGHKKPRVIYRAPLTD